MSRTNRPSGWNPFTALTRLTQALQNPNVRRYVTGQAISHTGQWIQQTAELWVILLITGSGIALGVHAALRFGPLLLFGLYGGLIADRVDRRKLIIVTQGIHAAATTTLAVVVWLQPLTVTLIYAIVLVQGVVNAIDNPVRRSFLRDLATDGELSNAVSLLGSAQTVTRAAGPAIAGLIIATAGVEWAFALNAASYVPLLILLSRIDVQQLRQRSPAVRGPRQLREGFVYAYGNRRIRTTLILTVFVSIFAWNWNVLLPVYATTVLRGGAALYGSLVSVLSIGSLLGALYTARLPHVRGRYLAAAGALVSVSMLLTAIAPGLLFAMGALALLGAAGTAFSVGAQGRLQLNVDDTMDGRVMALYSVGFVGSKPIGGLLGGWLVDMSGPRAAFAVGAAVVAVCTVLVRAQSRRVLS